MTFYFYDLETTGVRPRKSRIMQFGGQRTDLNLKPIGEPDNILIKLSSDILPDPDAVLVHGITPQQTLLEGVSEAHFANFFAQQVATKDTILVGFNNVRFDDEFIRFLLWRNFYDPYEWHWKDGRSRWDLLDFVRMTRALRPDGINWPFAADGKASNRLELLSSVNKLDHDLAHDALSDVKASLAIARLIQNKQPKLFDYLLNLRDKNRVQSLVNSQEPLLYTSGRYPGEFEKTTIAVMVGAHPDGRGAFMYDLRTPPGDFLAMDPGELAARWQLRDENLPQFPVKLLRYNRCPALAPLSVLDKTTSQRLALDQGQINENLKLVKAAGDFADKLSTVQEIMSPKAQPELVIDEQKVDEQLYDGFVNEVDRTKMSVVRAAQPDKLQSLKLDFDDDRLKALFPLYKARNFPESLNSEEQLWWEEFKTRRLLDGEQSSAAAQYFKRLEELSQQKRLNNQQKYLLEELKLYGQSIVPMN